MAEKNQISNQCFIDLGDNFDDEDNDDFEAQTFTVKNKDKVYTSELICLIGSDDPKEKRMLNSSVTKIIRNNDYNAFRDLLENGYKLQVMNNEQQTALHLAFYHNSHAIFTLLKKDDFCKIIDNDYADWYGLTHFHIACAKGHTKLVETLLKYTSDINVRFHTDPNGRYSGFTPFHFAVMNNTRHRVQIMNFLIEHGADVYAKDSLKRTALHLASCIFDHPRASPRFEMFLSVVQILVGKHKIDINAKDANNDTPLLSIFPKKYNELETYYLHNFHESDFIGQTNDKLDFLLKRGADVTVSNNDGDNVLHLILMILRRSRYTPSMNLRRYINCLEVTDANFIEFSHFDVHYEKMIEKVLYRKKKVNVNARNHSDQTPLKLAVSCMNINIIKFLLKRGANVNSLRFDEPNFFCYLYIVPNYDVVKNLLDLLELLEDNGFNITLEDNLEILKFLIHSNTECDCGIKTDKIRLTSKKHDTIYNLMCAGSPRHIKNILQSIYNDQKIKKNDHLSYLSVIGQLKNYLDRVEAAKIYIDEDIKNLATKLIVEKIPPSEFKMYFGDDNYLRAEAPAIKSVKLAENIKLKDLLIMKPENIPHYIVKDHFNRKIVHEFHRCTEAIRGHMGKNIVRYYTMKSAGSYFGVLSGISLPELICKKIMNLISNEDLLNMCLATMIQNDDCQV